MKEDIKARLAAVGASVPRLLFPKEGVDLQKFAVVACDQYSAQEEYWAAVRDFVGGAPSALQLMMPEAWLGKDSAHESAIPSAMERYLADGTLQDLGEGLMFLHRTTTTGVRRGLMLLLDLEQYDFTPGSVSMIRATEKTIVERLPPRVAIRSKAPLEMPHVMVLLDDRGNRLMGAMDQIVNGRKPLYDFPLMMDSGQLKGWFLQEESVYAAVAEALTLLQKATPNGMLYAMGDGNHSFAAAKAHWNAIKQELPTAEQERHPARFGLVELVNLYDPALAFEPIHRLLIGVDPAQVQQDLAFDAENPPSLQQLQPQLDGWLARHPSALLEYIHGADDCRRLGQAPDRLAIVWDRFDKESLFSDVARHGVLCRKSFSMGSAPDKRFYLECRKIR
ncbi:MAG: DUF1015 domain-containing protein [Oscillospiraceae bacterium]|nr:DUF1015 domain-containing protein [Oscillospiraceae bacterium]